MQSCHCASYSANTHSCFTIQISVFIASSIYDVPNFNKGILTLRRVLDSVALKKQQQQQQQQQQHDQETHVRRVYLLMYLGHSILDEAKARNWM